MEKTTIRILILEDVPTDAELMEYALHSAGIDFISVRTDSKQAFIESLDRFSPQIILSDYSLPSFDGWIALGIARNKAPEVPFIFVTGALGEERAVELLKTGATDFVLKGRLSRLPLCVDRALKEVEEKRTRKEAEDSLIRTHAVLETKVVELERMNQELQEFAFAASHDLKEPLRKIQVIGSMLREKKQDQLDEEGKDYLRRMEVAAGRMQGLLEALLIYSFVTKRERPFVPLDLNSIVQQAVENLDASIQQDSARVKIGSLPPVIGDPKQMVQVFENLLSNALKYRSGSAPLIRIHGKAENGKVRISVEANGIGFEEKHLEKIFKPFQRLHGRSEYEGIGMGLTISRKILERHGGKIDAKSTPGKGSTFLIELPAPSFQKQEKKSEPQIPRTSL